MQKFAEKYWEKSQPGKEVDANSYRLSQQQNIFGDIAFISIWKRALEDGFRREVDVRKTKANTTNILEARPSYRCYQCAFVRQSNPVKIKDIA
jgi:hypothetical protein